MPTVARRRSRRLGKTQEERGIFVVVNESSRFDAV